MHAEHQVDPARWGRADLADLETLTRNLAGIDTVIHLAGVNRADSDYAVEQGNVELAELLAQAIVKNSQPLHVVYGNSVQASLDNAYGRGKGKAATILADALAQVGGTLADVRLPNLFGEHGRTAYNSFVATFCHEVANGRQPQVTGDKSVPLLHAQDAASVLVEAAATRVSGLVEPDGELRGVSEVLGMLVDFHATYAEGQIPALPDKFTVDLFNTYRSYMFPQHFPFRSTVHADHRGELFETVRSHGGTGQTFVSTTVPGATRGDHFHLSKVERFFVIKGTAEIALRRVYDDQVVRFRLEGGEHAFVDMPTLWVHNITNVGDDELVTMFWTDQLLNPAAPDTYWEPVENSDSEDTTR
jgi:UDP-2-acetamido-2,6-beta-L-arabino-hexul-4-ose reductase